MQMSSDIVISVKGVSKRFQMYAQPRDRLLQFLSFGRRQYYKEFWALRDISFEVKKGETLGIIGRNGSGKSTLLQIICGTLTPNSGSISISGRIAALLELGAGFNPEFTGRENVLLNAVISGFPHEKMLDRMEQVLDFSELHDFIDQPVKTYSSGMYARLAFSAAIYVDPEILIVDESLAVGDAKFVAKCMRRIREIKDQGTSILFVSHDVGSVRTLCERVVWLDKGELVEQGDVFPVTGRYMAFMFSDDAAEEKIQSRDIQTRESSTADSGNSQADDLAQKDPVEDTTAGYAPSLDSRPVTHWGSNKGLIIAAKVRDHEGVCKDIFHHGDSIEIFLRLHIPVNISRENLSVAFSIKDLKGTDLVVSTTHDFNAKRLPDNENFEVIFRMKNYLNTGKYLLVAAVENRYHKDIHYFEYIEGAHYFSSLCNDRIFGVFQPQIDQKICIADAII